jgi:hypothetical protein
MCAALSNRTPAEILGDDNIADEVDAALAESPTITRFLDASPKKSKGHLHIEFKETFQSNLEANEREVGFSRSGSGDPNLITKGFTDLKRGEIHLRERVATVEGAVHEAIHLNSQPSSNPGVSQFQLGFGHPMEEGVTQYFANEVLREQTIGSGTSYPDQLAMAETLISCIGVDLVGKAYFKGERGAAEAVVRQFNQAHSGPGGQYQDWYKASRGTDADDWKKATEILNGVFGK